MSNLRSDDREQQYDEFVALLARHDLSIRRFVRFLLPSSDGVDDVVQDAGLHRVYMTEPIWDSSMSGQWLHLAAVFDPARRIVMQYLNGQPVSQHEIVDKFLVTQLRIGPAEIGNWGQPFRDSPWFAVRNLNGTIDELAIFDAALTDGEIRALYEQGKPLGY